MEQLEFGFSSKTNKKDLSILDSVKESMSDFGSMELDDKVNILNELRQYLHDISPFKLEPVDLVTWVKVEEVVANDYNPNSVAPPEMKLLAHSINHDGYTQPVVTWISTEKEQREVIDGFHRSKVCRDFEDVNKRVMGYLPVVTMRDDNTGKSDRISSTIRHNRARGKHNVMSMSEIVLELKQRNWSDERVSKELGMDADEVLRLSQINGLKQSFKDRSFSESWEYKKADDIEETELDWPSSIQDASYEKGWNDKTDGHSFLSDGKKRLGSIQKSHFDDSWFWYSYTKPMTDGKAKDKDEAKKSIEACYE